ncbi:MAG TPA: hypothetical protein VJ728_03540 [Candidatus Binataceae bacterium]|nr:hypothetical protein [Candidatus Binataceae bacterium]
MILQRPGNSETWCITLMRWPRVAADEIIIAWRELLAELQRLNNSSGYASTRKPISRRKRTEAFKAALAQRYREHNRCC